VGEIDVLAELRKENPGRRVVDLRVFADALEVYKEASANVRENGAIVMHPRTGAPIENPYLMIETAAGAVLAKMRGVKADKVLRKIGLG